MLRVAMYNVINKGVLMEENPQRVDWNGTFAPTELTDHTALYKRLSSLLNAPLATTDEPITVCSRVVSVVIRDWISVGWFASKNPGCSLSR